MKRDGKLALVHSCDWPDCPWAGAHGIGWGLSTGLVQHYCATHFAPALVRVARLLEVVRRVRELVAS